jgi:hypothetical protein
LSERGEKKYKIVCALSADRKKHPSWISSNARPACREYYFMCWRAEERALIKTCAYKKNNTFYV